MLDWVINSAGKGNAVGTYVVFPARDRLREDREIKVSVSISPGTFPELGDNPVAQVHVVRVTAPMID